MVTQAEIDQINKVFRGETTANKAKQAVIKIASRNQRSNKTTNNSQSNVLTSQPAAQPAQSVSQPVATAPVAPYKPKGWSNVVDTFELIGRKVGNVFVPGQPFTDNRDITPTTTSQKWTNFLTSPGFVFGAPALAAAAPLLVGSGSAAATGSVAATTTAATVSRFASMKNLFLAGGAGLLAGSLFGGSGSAQTAPQNLTQQPTQTITPSQITTPSQIDNSLHFTDQRQIFKISGSPGASIWGSQTAPTTAQTQSVVPTQSTSGTQDTSGDQAQSAGTGISPLILVAGLALLAMRD